MPENERTEWSRDVADAERGQRETMFTFGLSCGEEESREHQRRGLRVDEEVVVLERTADPAARGGLLRRLGELRGFVRTRRLNDLIWHY